MSDSLAVNVGLTLLVVVLMVPGLVIEPGPISEVIGFGAIGAIWGVDFLEGADAGGGG